MEPRISLVTLGVKDLQRAVRFYRDGLHWPVSSAGGGEIFFLRTAGVVLALFPRHLLAADANVPDGRPGFGGITLAHNVATREEVDMVLATARAAGATIIKPAEQAPWGGYSGYFSDPDGYPWEVAWNPTLPLGPNGRILLPE